VTPRELFAGLLGASVRRRRVAVSPAAEAYVVRVLGGMVSARLLDGPLCLALADPRESAVRRVGDEALFVSGYFPEHLERRGLSPAYVARLGSSAYLDLAGRRGEPFGELSRRFVDLRDAVGDVRRECDAAGMDAMALLSAWLRTGSEPFRRRLAELGVLLPPAGSS
jgi:hypothetical protein